MQRCGGRRPFPGDSTCLRVGFHHGFLESRVDEVFLSRSVNNRPSLVGLHVFAGQRFNRAKQILLRGRLESPVHSSEAHVGEVAQPLEVGNGYAAGVQVDVRYDEYPPVQKNLVGACRDRSIRAFANDPGLDVRSVLLRDLPLQCCGDKNVAVLGQHFL